MGTDGSTVASLMGPIAAVTIVDALSKRMEARKVLAPSAAPGPRGANFADLAKLFQIPNRQK